MRCRQSEPLSCTAGMVMISCSICSNAGKFTSSGRVCVTLSVVKQAASTPVCVAGSGRAQKTPCLHPARVAATDELHSTTVDSNDSTAEHYLCITVANTPNKPPIEDPETCFVPFKDKGGGTNCLLHFVSVVPQAMVALVCSACAARGCFAATLECIAKTLECIAELALTALLCYCCSWWLAACARSR